MDYFSKHGAAVLASRIESYWRARGFAGIVAERYRLDFPGFWGVRSNIGHDGFPPRQVELRAA